MNHPVDDFCQILADFPPEEARTLVDLCCLAVGVPDKPTGLPPDQVRFLRDLSHPFTVDDLRKRMMYLHDRQDVLAAVLIPGLLHYLTAYYERLADPNEVSGRIDQHLEIRRNLGAELAKPIEQRAKNLNDERIRRLLKIFEDAMADIPSQKKGGEQIAERLHAEWAERFTPEYWKAWTAQYLESIKPPGI